LDVERVADGLNAWPMQDTDIIKHDVCTKEQEEVITARLARGPLSAKSIEDRIHRLSVKFTKERAGITPPQPADGSSAPPADIFFSERFEVQTKSDVAVMVKKRQDHEAANFATLAIEGAKSTETLRKQGQFKFRSATAKWAIDKKMALRENERAAKMKARAKVQQD